MDKNERKHLTFQLFTEIGIIGQLITTEFNKKLPKGLLISHFGILNHMCRLGDGQAPIELANAFQVSKASMSNSLNKLQKKKLIIVRNNPNDGRSKLVFLTKKGQKTREQAIVLLNPVLEQLDLELDLEKIVTTLPLLKELREHIDNNRNVLSKNIDNILPS